MTEAVTITIHLRKVRARRKGCVNESDLKTTQVMTLCGVWHSPAHTVREDKSLVTEHNVCALCLTSRNMSDIFGDTDAADTQPD